jgi:hypothetical protein
MATEHKRISSTKKAAQKAAFYFVFIAAIS